jgi:hypothetical protein
MRNFKDKKPLAAFWHLLCRCVMRNFCTAQGVTTSFANNRLDFKSDDRGLIVSALFYKDRLHEFICLFYEKSVSCLMIKQHCCGTVPRNFGFWIIYRTTNTLYSKRTNHLQYSSVTEYLSFCYRSPCEKNAYLCKSSYYRLTKLLATK